MPKFSIIIPCYNSSKTIEETLNTIYIQNDHQIEIICINDGSTDSTLEVLNSLKKRFTNMIVINQENKGVSVARNAGIDSASGEWIVFLDSDDGFRDNYFRVLRESIEKIEADVIYFKLIHSEEKPAWGDNNHVETKLENKKEFFDKALYYMGDFGFYCYAYRKSIIDKYSLSFPVGVRYGEDREFIWKYLVHCNNALYVDMQLYWYRDNPKSAIYKTSWDKTEALKAVESTYSYLKKNQPDYADEYYKFMHARNMLSLLFSFASGKRKDLFDRLKSEYDVKKDMKYLMRYSPQKYAQIASLVYFIMPEMFYFILSRKKHSR